MGKMYGMKRTTIYLPDDLKKKVEKLAKKEKRSEAEFMRNAIAVEVSRRLAPRPRVPIPGLSFGDSTVAERVDEILAEGFGE
jgi:hypothetical protein